MCQICAANPMSYTGGSAAGSSQPSFASATMDMPQAGGAGSNFLAFQGATGDQNINGLLSGSRWGGGTVTYSFPTAANLYEGSYSYDNEPQNAFMSAPEAVRVATRAALNLVSQYTNLITTEVAPTINADIRSAFSGDPGTAWGYYPGNGAAAGDVWYGRTFPELQNPIRGQYAWATVLHELGHALGLKHGHEGEGVANTALQSNFDQMAFSLMTYRSYAGASLTGGFTNELNGYAQTYMIYDIAALQTMYGANFNTNAGNTTYSWSPTTGEMFINGVGQGAPGGNRVFLTVWDGNGNDTYDFSNYTSNLSINLSPGQFSVTSAAQLANLGFGNMAPGNVFNALQYNGDTRSLIENANGGSGDDWIVGNDANNTLIGGGGNDTIDGGSGTDTAVFSSVQSAYTLINYNGQAVVFGFRDDGTDTLSNVEFLKFANNTVTASSLPVFKPYDYLASNGDLIKFIGNNPTGAWNHYLNFGAREGRQLDNFGNFQYVGSFDDLVTSIGANQDAAARHYVQWGFLEGRGTSLFNFLEYAATYTDLLTALSTNQEFLAQHYILYGRIEGRVRDDFDNLRYTASYNDLIDAFGTNRDAALNHFVNNGFAEGRSKTGFDAIQYIASYGDLIGAFGLNSDAATAHFITSGKAEGRARDNFNATQYLANYADLRAIFGTNEDAATRHYIQYGFGEYRTDLV